MPEIAIGARSIEYEVLRSTRAARKRIEVTPGKVEVIVPEGANLEDIEAFVRSKRRWLHDKTEEVREELARLRADTPRGLHSGAKVLFRGRYLKLRVESADVEKPELIYRTGFHVRLPRPTPAEEREPIVRGLLEAWLRERLVDDAWAIVRQRGVPNELRPMGIQIKEQRTLWGSCGRDGVLRLDRKLARVPRPVFEYVVVHELCHLRHRNHSPAFWSLVRRLLPDYTQRREWLERHEVAVG